MYAHAYVPGTWKMKVTVKSFEFFSYIQDFDLWKAAVALCNQFSKHLLTFFCDL